MKTCAISIWRTQTNACTTPVLFLKMYLKKCIQQSKALMIMQQAIADQALSFILNTSLVKQTMLDEPSKHIVLALTNQEAPNLRWITVTTLINRAFGHLLTFCAKY